MAVKNSTGHVCEHSFLRLLASLVAFDEATVGGLRAPGCSLLLSHTEANLIMALVLAIMVVKSLVGPRLLQMLVVVRIIAMVLGTTKLAY